MQSNIHLRAFPLFFLFLLAALAPSCVAAQSYPPNGPTVPAITLNGSAPIQEPPPNPPNQQSQWNMELVAQSDIQGSSPYQPIVINKNGPDPPYVVHQTADAIN